MGSDHFLKPQFSTQPANQILIATIRSNFLTEAPGQYTGGMQMQGQGQMMQVQYWL